MGLLGTIATVAGTIRQALPPLPTASAAALLFPPRPGAPPPEVSVADTSVPEAVLPVASEIETQAPDGILLVRRPTPPSDPTLRRELGELAARSGEAEVRSLWLQRAAHIMGAPTASPEADTEAGPETLGARFSALVQSWQAFSAEPKQPERQRAAIAASDALARGIRSAATATEALAGDLGTTIAAAVNEVNGLLNQVHRSNRSLIGLAARGESSADFEAERDQALSTLAEWTGVQIFPRENRQVALYTADGTALLEQRPLRLRAPGAPEEPGTVPAAQVIRYGRLGALLALGADGSVAMPPTQPSRDVGGEIVRKLRSHLDAMTQVLTGRTRTGQPVSVADAYDSAPCNEPGTLPYGVFRGSRLDLDTAPGLMEGTCGLKTGAAKPVAAALTVRRTLATDGFSLPATSAETLFSAIDRLWQESAKGAVRENGAASSALESMEARASGPPPPLEQELAALQTLDSARGSSLQLSRGSRELLSVLRGLSPRREGDPPLSTAA